MKKLGIILFLLFMFLVAGRITYSENFYTCPVEVVEVGQNNTTIFKDIRGELWVWNNEENESFTVGEKVKLYMCKNGTYHAYGDDYIVKVKG